MDHKEKIFALIGKEGKAKVAEYLDMTMPTFASRMKNPGDWKVRELEIIDNKYKELFGEPVK